jgi:hypothetical protein
LDRRRDFTVDELLMIAPVAKELADLAELLDRPVNSVNRKLMELAAVTMRPNALSALVRNWVGSQDSARVQETAQHVRFLRASSRPQDALSLARERLGMTAPENIAVKADTMTPGEKAAALSMTPGEKAAALRRILDGE